MQRKILIKDTFIKQSFMKNAIYYTFCCLLLLTFACTKENPTQEQEQEQVEETLVVCESDPFQFYIEVEGIELTADSCWVVYVPHDPNSNIIVDEKWAVLKWEYPGFPSWNSANSFAFAYGDSDSELESGQSYEARQIAGVVQFDGSNGEMFGALGEDGAVTFNIDEFNPESGFICGNFEGRALFTNDELVDLKGSFKGHLNP